MTRKVKNIHTITAQFNALSEVDSCPCSTKTMCRQYGKVKRDLQIELLKMQNWIKATGQKVIIIFEGRDAAGKTSAIKSMMKHLDPKGAKIVALEKPSKKEKGQWYFQRYIKHFPSEGEIVLYDRSWYNRAGVERVMGFCTDKEYKAFMNQVATFERLIVKNGIKVFKLWFSVTPEDQLIRIEQRKNDKLKTWKLSPIDLLSVTNWDKYTKAKDEMFKRTDIKAAPWMHIEPSCKKRARIQAMLHLLNTLNYTEKPKKIK